MIIGNKEFDIQNKTYVMGILNVTPDSFSDGGRWNNVDAALKHAEQMISEGAHIIDVGGESTRPGHTKVEAEEEIRRTVPVVEAIKKRFDIPISIDTYKSSVAKENLLAGADLVNDIWGLKYDDEIAKVIADASAACCLMHNRDNTHYHDFMEDVKNDLKEVITIAKKAGIKDEKIILDPGVGFVKSYEQNLEVIHCLEQFRELGYPVLLGTSRKSVIGTALDLPADERLEGTLVTTVMAVMKGCAFVRVHDIKENVRTIRMTEAILGRQGN
ncbi:dihydropteroate synthase [Aminipila terrae]|uniref:Dihydropteroate synthase n=1 Tax=Aminipila terrae TaxID=2697030 RepID=A0A6P1MB44_9FIRM|nr:dihydropteroate synthase [Aminipila terrae]QHI71147.1 dihydropteroate synthase [Aminipila terrae]